jgi:hypothetical protein
MEIVRKPPERSMLATNNKGMWGDFVRGLFTRPAIALNSLRCPDDPICN